MNSNLGSDHVWAVGMILAIVLVLGGCGDGEASTAPLDAEAPDAETDAGDIDAAPAQDASVDAGDADAGVEPSDPDAGVDAGTADAGVDAGTADAGVDAGTVDAGVDAGTADAGVDAGTADAAVGMQLLANPTFDTSLEGWDLSQPSLVEWDMEDMDGSSSSGSARLTNDSTEAESEMVLLRQCLPLPEAGIYEVSASARMLEGQTTTGSVVARVNVYSSTTECSGGLGLSSGRFITQSAEGWQTSTFTIERGETAVGNMMAVEIGVRKTEDTGEMVVLVDNVRLTLLP